MIEYNCSQIPPGTSSHSRIRLDGKGLKKINSRSTGDHYVVVKIKAPASLNSKQKAAIKVNWIVELNSFRLRFLSSKLIIITCSCLFQAYAELEKNTPGHIMGIGLSKQQSVKSKANENRSFQQKISDTFNLGTGSIYLFATGAVLIAGGIWFSQTAKDRDVNESGKENRS